MLNKRGQMTIFIIIAIVIVVGVVIFFVLRQNLSVMQIPASIQPVYSNFLSCLEDKTSVGIDVLESQAGYIELPEFERGSSYMPFSSQLNFFGNPIPYWYYVSGNNIEKEQVPSEREMEQELEKFVEERIRECNFDNYYEEGFEIVQEEPKASVDIRNNQVNVNLNMDLIITKDEDNAVIGSHEVIVNSNLGALYDSAKKIYEKEQDELFLEDYGLDILRLYAPVDGVEITCSPKTWDADEVFDDLQEAIETNTLALNTQSPSNNEEKYFFVDTGVGQDVRFINSKAWKGSSFEVSPSDGNMLVSSPVGTQPGLGVLGFCYVPYHFVYNVKYPVLVQVYEGDEIFQFPLAVIIEGNQPRKALDSTASSATPDLCPYKNTMATVNVYDYDLNSVDASVSYECFGTTCDIGETSSGTLTSEFPQCVNGYIVVRADGFEEVKYQYSTTRAGSASIVMDKIYNLDVNLKLNNVPYTGDALIYFVSEENSKVVSYPDQKIIKLSAGQYEVAVYIYEPSSIKLQGTTSQQCMDVPASGIGGLFGFTDQKCFDVEIPPQIISNVLAGGGTQDYYFLEEDLKNSNAIDISADGFTTPDTLEDLQNNYLVFEDKELEISLR